MNRLAATRRMKLRLRKCPDAIRARRFGPIGLLTLLGIVGCARGPSPPSHLVLVVFDTLRADRMSVYGYSRQTTPFLETLVDESVLFARAKAPAPWTVPSHASMFTGLPPARHGAQWGRMYLEEEISTLAEVLQDRGFCTRGLSANELVGRATGLAQGFELFRVFDGSARSRSAVILSQLPAILEEAKAHGCRLFLFLNLMDTHIPYNTGRFAAEFGAEGAGPVRTPKIKWAINAGARSFAPEAQRLHAAAYDAAVRRSDEVAAEILGLLDEGGWSSDTLLVLTSDHGDGLGAHPEIGHVISLWEEQLAVPLIVRFPDGWNGGTVVPTPVGLTSLMPSLLDWLAIDRPATLRQVPGLLQETEEPVVADYRSYFSESNRHLNERIGRRYPDLAARVQHAHAVYCGDHKLIVRERQPRSLYDLEKDRTEQEDLASWPSPQLQRCVEDYREAQRKGLLTPFDYRPDTTSIAEAERRLDLEALRSLGYVQ